MSKYRKKPVVIDAFQLNEREGLLEKIGFGMRLLKTQSLLMTSGSSTRARHGVK